MVIFHFAAFDKFRNRLRKVLDKCVDAPTRTACGQSLNSRHTSRVCAEPIHTFSLFHDHEREESSFAIYSCARNSVYFIFTFRRIWTSGAGIYGLTTMHAKQKTFSPKTWDAPWVVGRGWAQYSLPCALSVRTVFAIGTMSFYGISAFPLFISMLYLLHWMRTVCARLTLDCRLRTDTHNCVFVCSFLFENVLKRMCEKLGTTKWKYRSGMYRKPNMHERATLRPRHGLNENKKNDRWDTLLFIIIITGKNGG